MKKSYTIRLAFDKTIIYDVEVKAGSHREAVTKAKERLARRLFKPGKITYWDKIEN